MLGLLHSVPLPYSAGKFYSKVVSLVTRGLAHPSGLRHMLWPRLGHEDMGYAAERRAPKRRFLQRHYPNSPVLVQDSHNPFDLISGSALILGWISVVVVTAMVWAMMHPRGGVVRSRWSSMSSFVLCGQRCIRPLVYPTVCVDGPG